VRYEALREECDRERIGPLLWSLLVEVAGRVARKYPPHLYNDGETWSEEAHADLAQEVALARLIEENQLGYVLTAAEQSSGDRYEALARLLAFQVRRVLSHRRRKTVVDRLHSRVKALVAGPGFQTVEVGGDTAVALEGGGPSAARQLSDDEIRRGASLIAAVPRLPSRLDAERESKVYTAAHLEEAVRTLAGSLGPLFLGDIRRILELVLTAWVPTLLRDHEEDYASATTSTELELERAEMRTTIASLAADLDPVHRVVLLGKSQDISDGDLAQRVGISRPTLAKRKTEALARVQAELIEELPRALHDEAIRHLLDACAVLEGEEDV
jgi:DNA-binding Xre family transcriptional regulator